MLSHWHCSQLQSTAQVQDDTQVHGEQSQPLPDVLQVQSCFDAAFMYKLRLSLMEQKCIDLPRIA